MTKAAGEHFCLARIAGIADSLSLFGWPHAAVLGIVAGLFCFTLGFAGFFRPQKSAAPSALT